MTILVKVGKGIEVIFTDYFNISSYVSEEKDEED